MDEDDKTQVEPGAVPTDVDEQDDNKQLDDVVPKSKFEDVQKSRDKMKERLRELEAKEAEREKQAQDEKWRKMEEAQQYEELKAEMQKERDEARKQLEDERQERRFTEYTKQVADVANVSFNEAELVLQGMIAKGNFQIPESIDKRSVDTGTRKLRDAAPSLFKPKTRGGAPADTFMSLEKNTKEWAEAIAKKMSPESNRKKK